MAEGGKVISCQSIDEWKEHLNTEKNPEKLVVVDFTASWCGPCRFMAPILADLAKNMPDVLFLKVDVDVLEDVAKEYEVEAMPTFIFMRRGEVIDKVVGAKKDDLHSKLVNHGGGVGGLVVNLSE